jgi:DNA-binding XRE family transcriptional regulator
VTFEITYILWRHIKMRSNPLIYTPEWLISFQKEVAGAILLTQDTGDVICDHRKRYDMSQQEFGELMGLRRESISRIENGSVTPTFDFARKFINAVSLIEAIRVERAQHKELDVHFLEELAKELGFNRKELELMIKVGVESYDKKRMKIQKSLKENKT